jgi:hypothetical protein
MFCPYVGFSPSCYKPEWVELILTIHLIHLATVGPGVYAASNRNEYQKQKNNVSGEADDLIAICEPIVQTVGSLTSHNLIGLHALLWG